MKKKRNTKSHLKPIDFIVGIICIAGMATALFLFQKDLNFSSTKQNEEPVAVIYFKYKTAQRNFADKNLWELLKTASKIYNGDRIRTAALSEAYLLFNDGSKIDLHENTLIRIIADNSQNALDFITGSVSVTSSNDENKISIKTGDKYLNFKGNSSAEIKMSERGSKNATVAVTSGSIDVSKSAPKKNTNAVKIIRNPQIEENEESKIETLKLGDTISYSTKSISSNEGVDNKKEGSTVSSVISDKVNSDDITVFIPSTTYSVTINDDKKANAPFYWTSAKDTRLEFSNSADFSIITSANKLPFGNNKASVPVTFTNNDELNLYWRIVPLDKTNSKVYESGMIIGRQEDNVELAKVAKESFGEKKSATIIKSAKGADEILEKNQLLLPVAKEEKIVPVEKQIAVQKQKEDEVEKQLSITKEEIEQSAKKEEVERFEKIKAQEIAERKQKEKIAAEKKAKEEKIAKAKAEAAKKAAEEKAVKQKAEELKIAKQKALEKAAAEQRAKKEKLAQEKAIAEKKAQEEKLAQEKATAEKKAQEEKLAQEKAIAEKKAQEEKLAQEKARAEQKAAEAKAEQEKIAKEKAKILPAAELLVPFYSTEFTEEDFNEENPEIKFAWSKVENASWYRFTIYQGTEEDTKIVQYKVKDTSVVLKGKRLSQIKNGTVTWKVEAVYEKNNETVYGRSSISSFTMNVADVENVQLDTSDLLLDE